MNPKVSVIVPVFNAEKYLRRALDSLCEQTLKDFEVLLIDDGSKDSSGKICDEYALKDSRFKVIHKENEGVSKARQTGLDISLGEYVIHVDSDDWIEPMMLEKLYNKALSENADMVICDYYVNTYNEQILRLQKPTDIHDNSLIIEDLFNQLHGSCWNKLIRRFCFNKYSVFFPQGLNYCEDKLTIIRLLKYNIKVTYLNEPLYHYYDNPKSITRNYKRSQYENRIEYLNLLKLYLHEQRWAQLLQKELFGIFVEGCIYDVLTKNEIQNGIKEYNKQIEKLSPKWRFGFLLLKFRCYTLFHKLVHF